MQLVKSSIIFTIALVAMCKLVNPAPIASVAINPTQQDINSGVNSQNPVAFATGNFLPKRLTSRGYKRKGNKNNGGQSDSGNQTNYGPTTSSTSSSAKPTSPAGGGGYSGDGTYYSPSVGTSACGTTSADTELVAAINAPQWGASANPNNSPSCGKCAKVTGPNGTVTVKIVDKCPSCAYGSLDLSPTAFSKIASLDAGRVQITWSYC
ncbi:hypothetical protein K7432_009425 [Basidiobolus ranarum]|uniref:RlpA-like protein double-psi beta-barrel domain-containing protein n=1 Tax=Basidiobolus ranarum TaxID=34480 RepID=A0ABR2WQB2_9FUNG